jgi:molybdopterin molybdotransferase
MIHFEKALEIVLSSSFLTGTERIPFTDSLNRILAEDIVCDTDMPPFNKASMDGFACRRMDIGSELEIIETIPAGKWPEKNVGPLQCSKIMTGAPIPEGADCVIIVEETELVGTGRIKFTGSDTRNNIAIRGEDIKKNETVLRSGRKIEPQDIAVMATAGHTETLVSRKPVTGVISTGSEIVEPDKVPGLSQIRNSNSSQLMAQTERAGAEGRYYGIAKDDEDETLEVVSRAINECDIVLITGGVSMGDFDFVPLVLEGAGVKILFTRVAVQPGKPTTFGVHRKALVFGLPGNPVSSFILFEMLVRPLISRMMGYEHKPFKIILPMRHKYTRRSSERMGFIPVNISDDGEVVAVEYHGSAHISSLPAADGIIAIASGLKEIEKGKPVNVILI